LSLRASSLLVSGCGKTELAAPLKPTFVLSGITITIVLKIFNGCIFQSTGHEPRPRGDAVLVDSYVFEPCRLSGDCKAFRKVCCASS
jgi:hypothetical protein